MLIERGLIAPYPKDDPAARRLARNKRRNKRHLSSKGNQLRPSHKDLDDDENEDEDNNDDDEDKEEEGSRDQHRINRAINDYDDDDEDDDAMHPVHVGEAYFPLEALEGGGRGLKTGGWAERLFREEDMKPHKNFAYCR